MASRIKASTDDSYELVYFSSFITNLPPTYHHSPSTLLTGPFFILSPQTSRATFGLPELPENSSTTAFLKCESKRVHGDSYSDLFYKENILLTTIPKSENRILSATLEASPVPHSNSPHKDKHIPDSVVSLP